MRVIAALALARLASASSVSSTLAAYQKFTDELVTQFEKKQVPAATDGSQDTVTDKSGFATNSNTTEATAQVSTNTGVDSLSTNGDKQTILQVITWLDALYTDSLKADHEADVDLMLKCQERIDACEDVTTDKSSPTGAAHDYASQNSKVLYGRIGSVCQKPTGSWSTTGPNFNAALVTETLGSTDVTKGTVGPSDPNAPDCSGDGCKGFQLSGGSFLSDAPWTETASLWATMHNQCMRHKTCRINHQQPSCGDVTGGQKKECDAYDAARELVANQFPTCARKPKTATCSPEPLQASQVFSGDKLYTFENLGSPGKYLHATTDKILVSADSTVSAAQWSIQKTNSAGAYRIANENIQHSASALNVVNNGKNEGTQLQLYGTATNFHSFRFVEVGGGDYTLEFLWQGDTGMYVGTSSDDNAVLSSDATKLTSKWRIVEAGSSQVATAGTAIAEPCMRVKDALSDDFIRQEWWFVESNTVENCLDEVAEWFVGCTLNTGEQSAATSGSSSTTCVGKDGVWFWYQDCDDALKKCAEATLTCDDIQHEFEAAACDWTSERTESCHKHHECYDTEIEACAKNCRLIQHRVVGRKAELEIIHRIKCMLNALLANNEQHASGTAESDDAGNKTSRLARCKTMGDRIDSSTYQLPTTAGSDTGGLDLLNITCQGPKKKTTVLTQSTSAFNHPVSPGVTAAGAHKWMIDLNGGSGNGDGVEEFDTHVNSHWMPGWRKSDYLAWEAEYPRGSQDDTVTGCGEDDVLGSTDTTKKCAADATQNKVTIEMEEETTGYSGATVERFSFSNGHKYNSKTGTATVMTKADGTETTGASTKNMVHRMPKMYQKWGYGCSTGYRPCTSSFIRASYGFLNGYADAARAPCTKCDGTFKNAQGTSDSSSVMDDPCNWVTQMSHSNNANARFDSGNAGTNNGVAWTTYGDVGDNARASATQHGSSNTALAICECFHSRDPNFCTTDMASVAKTCSGGSTAQSGYYCHDDHRNTNWDASCLETVLTGSLGCNGIQDRDTCLSSRDGRTHESGKVNNQPCVWCGAGAQSCGTNNKCEPYAWLVDSGKFQAGTHEVAACTGKAPVHSFDFPYVDQGSGACVVRGASGQSYDSAGWFLYARDRGTTAGALTSSQKVRENKVGLDSPTYKRWVKEAWKLCLENDANVKFVSVFNDGGFRCYTTSTCVPTWAECMHCKANYGSEGHAWSNPAPVQAAPAPAQAANTYLVYGEDAWCSSTDLSGTGVYGDNEACAAKCDESEDCKYYGRRGSDNLCEFWATCLNEGQSGAEYYSAGGHTVYQKVSMQALPYHLENTGLACVSGVNPSKAECESAATEILASNGWSANQIELNNNGGMTWIPDGCLLYMVGDGKVNIFYSTLSRATTNRNNAYNLICSGAA